MKLIKCYVSSFGKLKDFSFDFANGLNTIKEDNGWGKSTLATFIKSMFYGLNSTKRNIAENERLKYRPWNSTQMFGGFVEFEWGEKQYKIERYFGSKESEDSVRLFDLQSGKEFNNTENLGKRIFEIDEAGFLSTTYFSQKDFQVKSNSSLTAKFNSVCEVQDLGDFDKALSKLEEKAKLYKYRGDKGLISDTKKEIAEIDLEIEKTNRSAQTVKSLKEEVNNLQSEVEKLNKDRENLTKKISIAGEVEALNVKKSHYEQLLKEKQDLENEIVNIDKVLNGNRYSREEIANYITCNNDLLTASTNVKILRPVVEQMQKTKENQPKQKKTNQIPFLVLGSLFLIIAVVLGFVNIFVSIAGACLSLIFFIIFFALKSKKNEIISDDGFEKLYEEKCKDLEKYCKLENQISTAIDRFISKFCIGDYSDRNSALLKISKYNFEYEKTLSLLNEINDKLKEYDALNFTTNSNAEDLKTLQATLSFLQAEYSKKTNELASKKASLSYQESLANSMIELESKKEELLQKLQAYNEEYKIYNLTIEYLKKADENLKIKYREPLQNSLNKYLGIITDNLSAQIDIDLNVFVQEKDGEKDTDYYSKGYQNLIEICKRFALTDVLFKGEKPFIILDDPFYNLDDKKLNRSLDLIRALSEEYQILYFICHESRRG